METFGPFLFTRLFLFVAVKPSLRPSAAVRVLSRSIGAHPKLLFPAGHRAKPMVYPKLGPAAGPA